MPRSLFWFCLGILFLLTGNAAPLRLGAELRRDNATDIAPHPKSSRTYNEFWTYQFWLNEGIQAQVDLSRANFGSFKDPACGADLSLIGFKGRNYFVAREYKARNFAFDVERQRLS